MPRRRPSPGNGSAAFVRDVGARLGAAASQAAETAVLVVEAASGNQYADLVRTLGQHAADAFEAAMSRRIGALLPERARLHRVSAASFACAIAAAPGQAAALLDALAEQLRQPASAADFPLATSVGIGVAYHPRDGAGALELLHAAACAAHASLDEDKPWLAYSPSLGLASLRAARLLQDIGPALVGQGHLHLAYQPKLELRTDRCIGAEALLRWDHPALGPVDPGELLGLVELTSLMHAVTEWVLGTALPQVARWRAAGLELRVSLNVSMRDLCDARFAARLAAALARHAVQPAWISIEVTESALMTDPVEVGRQLDAIRQLGVAIEIDDFGVRRSALWYLKRIPAAFVKIDALFIGQLAHDRDDQIMVGATIDLVHALGRQAIAEGIKDAGALAWLRQYGCDIGQGDEISPPLDALDLERWLRERAPSP
jgi:EAL domain-containing protein (putative c-di-GMP-specific phosphodiesterase class I)/GGDEF domain-containing protein